MSAMGARCPGLDFQTWGGKDLIESETPRPCFRTTAGNQTSITLVR